MNLRRVILVIILLLDSGEYFTGVTDRVPRLSLKGSLAYEKPEKLPEKYWMEDSSFVSPYDIKEPGSTHTGLHLTGFQCHQASGTGPGSPSMLDPLFLDRPPPRQASLFRENETA